ncbi:serine hydrolase domain-containing protein [Kangiella shandongensis]|uniref:serine hydrolase domain-containing protein n=1 Tax=Kangiella shandongensis TaxID=2763258 RepID=UPI001CBF4038|nr:serine hydrolase domain-containing protein [Kangiella shandongensis]
MWIKMIKTAAVSLAALSILSGINLSIAEPISAKETKPITVTEQLDPYFEALANHNRFLGSVALYKGRRELYRATVEPRGKVSELTHKQYKYKIGSITKTFTAAIVFQLIEEKRLTLDTNLSEFYPEVVNAETITIKQLLNHHSGIHNYTADPDFLTYHQKPQDKTFLLSKLESFESDFKPGEKGAYSNSNYLLLGFIIEDIESKPFAEVVHERIVETLALENTFLGGRIDPDNGEAYSYQLFKEWVKVPEWDMSVAYSAGALVSTPADLNRFMQALFSGRLIKKSSLQQMIRLDDGFGKGIFGTQYQLDNKELQGYWHNGGIEAFISHVSYYPDHQITAVVLSNGLNHDVRQIYNVMLDAYFGKAVDVPTFSQEFSLSVEQLRQFVGNYQSTTHPLDISIRLVDGKLYGQATGQGGFPLTAIDNERFEYAKAGIEIQFDADGVQFEIKQAGRADIFTKVTEDASKDVVKVPLKTLEQYTGTYASDSFHLKLQVMIKDEELYAQATGQPAFPLTAVNQTTFKFDMADIVIEFNTEETQLTITQRGKPRVMTKK